MGKKKEMQRKKDGMHVVAKTFCTRIALQRIKEKLTTQTMKSARKRRLALLQRHHGKCITNRKHAHRINGGHKAAIKCEFCVRVYLQTNRMRKKKCIQDAVTFVLRSQNPSQVIKSSSYLLFLAQHMTRN